MDVSFAQTESYLAESPARLSEETVQSLYADEQPKKRVKPNMEHSKLAETVGIENTIMLNPEDLAKAARNDERDFNKNFGYHTRQTGNFGASRQRGLRRTAFESSESNDIAKSPSLTETRTSVIRGVLNTRAQQQNASENESVTAETDMESNEYSNLRCYEHVEKDNGDCYGRNRHYLQNSVMEGYATQADNQGHISEKFSRVPNSGNRQFQMSSMETRPTFSRPVRDAPYRVRHPPEFAISQMDVRGKQFFERSGLHPGSAMNYAGLNPKYNIQDGLYLPSHADMQSGYPGFGLYEGRPPVSSDNLSKNNNLPSEQEAVKSKVKNNPSPIAKIVEDEATTRQGSLERDVVNQGKQNERADLKQLDDNKNIKGKRGAGSKGDSNIQCMQCQKKFGSSSALAKHKATHSDERKYICSICEKGFKRQDHLNGHMMTHRDKKPFECKYCDKSYCDHRSLKRHYENYHPNPEQPQPVTTSAITHKTDTELQRISKPEGQFIADRDEGHPSPLSSKQEVPQAGFGRKRNSDSMCSNSSDDQMRRPDSHSPRILFDKPQTASSMLKQVIDSHELKEKHPMEGYPRAGYLPFPEGMNPQWYHQFQQAQMMKLMLNQAPPILVQHGPIPQMNPYCPTDPPQLVPNYPPISQHSSSEGAREDNNRKKGDDNGYKGKRDYVVPTDPTSIAIANAKEGGDHQRQAQFKEGTSAGFPRAVQWKTVNTAGKENNGMPPHSMGSNPTMQLPPSMMVSDHPVKRERPVELNIHIPSSTQGEKRPIEMVTTTAHQAKRHCPPSPASFNMAKEGLLKLADAPMKPEQANNNDNMFKNPPSTPTRKRPRPGPINISCSNFQYGPLSPPIYTPPPMLSPLSIFHPPKLVTTPITPGRFFLSGNRSRKNSHEEDGADTSTEILMPEPKINIGPLFQADVPLKTEPHSDAFYDKHRAAVCWTPFEHETKKRTQEIEAFLDMACSVAVFGGGSNKEYALHVLYRLKGNIKLAVRHILANKSAIQKEDGLADYHYEGSERWSSKERLKFREALDKFGKNFYEISKEIGTKSVQQCVEFYYLWKACRPEGTRSRRGYCEETDSERDNEDIYSDNDCETTYIFECDFPECNSKFISRQALNGHIRVHGGSFMKPEPKRVKAKTTTNSDINNSGVPVSTNVSRAATKPSRPTKPPAPPVLNGDGTLPEFPCKVCGRVFHKIKSRSAHMKTHVKRNDDDVGKSKS
ncbi:uncharacterized protein LOC114520130 [Dendronephthya gigantea]|uniref:uncharacterized protein LOC114520130 n=1 Tax=Dendronephthya gigantea TaxID=151771 RepID=UPI00106D4B7C|nr:uncharacterized protein LOC114520130 [Dendronephthya gigantea]XP_028396149.1 uncharacterized protein LOC114520130 [Dendronephthya gigantea]XP_028396150.1 uncharacterized protein LOC114520130 [Dendronephthya gigantea]XP_028396151.1 uncharacterized protein LOC114520130 [Dendronephthya gigantea]